jgi:hypothetical protein
MTSRTRRLAWWYAAIIFVPAFWYALAAMLYYTGLDHSYGGYARYVFLATMPFGLVCIGMAFYALRRGHRIFYGCVEVLAGLVLAFYAILPALDYWGAKEIVTMAAAFYVIVRGLDNVGEGLKAYPNASAKWEAIFPK